MIKIIHLADLHLDSPFASCTPSERAMRRAEQREALKEACEKCRTEKIDIMLIAGDLFDGDFILQDTPAFISDCFGSIPDTRIFIAPGNHDPYYARSPYKALKFSDNVHIFTEEKLSSVDIPELNTTVYGYAFISGSVREKPLENFKVSDTSRINLLVAHTELDTPASEYCNISGADLERSALDYAALGHIHNTDGFHRFGKTVCAYSGALLGRGFDECGEKGAIVGEVSCGSVSLKLVPVSERRYEICEIKLSGNVSDESIISEIKEKCAGFTDKTSLRIVLSGTVSREGVLSGVNMDGVVPGIETLQLKDKTVYVPDITELLSEQSLRGEFCRKIKPLLDEGDEKTRKTAALALKYGIQALHS